MCVDIYDNQPYTKYRYSSMYAYLLLLEDLYFNYYIFKMTLMKVKTRQAPFQMKMTT